MMKNLSLIVAMDQNNLIGKNNGLPWHLPADLAYFKQTTLGKPIVMGRKTHESIGRPLPGRRNIVITANPDYQAAGCDVANSLETAVALCDADDEIMLIGGASLYRQALHRAGSLYLTRIHHAFDGDTWFPQFDEAGWKLQNRQDFEPDQQNYFAYSFLKFVQEF